MGKLVVAFATSFPRLYVHLSTGTIKKDDMLSSSLSLASVDDDWIEKAKEHIFI
jgi:hypothetical protein